MMKKILFGFILLCFATIVFAQVPSFTQNDNFTSYNEGVNYLVISDTNLNTGWSLANDANAPTTVKGNITSYAQFVPIDVSKAGGNTGGISRAFDQNLDIPDWNTMNARLYMFVKLDSASQIVRAEVRLGNTSGRYFEYRNTSPYNQGWYLGWQLVSFDLNSPAAVVGTPSLVDLNFVQMNIVYNAGQGDFNVTFNRVWLEAPPNAFNDQWRVLDVSGTPDGWGIPFNYVNEGRGMALVDTNDPSLGNHGRIFLPQFNPINLSTYNIDWSIDVNQVDTNWGTRMLFDAANFSPGDNFSSCFLFDATSTSRRVGVEQWQNGNRTFTQSTLTMNYNDYNTMRCLVTGNSVAVYINGVLRHSGSVNSRIDGAIGLESFGGRSHFKNMLLTLTPDFQYPFIADNPIIQGVEDNIFPLAVLAIFAVILVLVLLTALQGGSITSILLMVGVGLAFLILYVLFTTITQAVG